MWMMGLSVLVDASMLILIKMIRLIIVIDFSFWWLRLLEMKFFYLVLDWILKLISII